MNPTPIYRLTLLSLILLLTTIHPPQSFAQTHTDSNESNVLAKIAADANHITLTLDNPPDRFTVYAYAADQKPEEPAEPIYTQNGTDTPATIQLPRYHQGSDLIYSRFLLRDQDGNTLGTPQWISEFWSPRWVGGMDWPDVVKGVSNPEDFDDLVELGVRHVHVNIALDSLFLPDDAPAPAAEFIRDINGVRLRFNPDVIADWDRKLKRMTDDGINVIAVILNPIGGDAADKGLIHPDTDVEQAPFKLGAFNLTTDRGIASFVGALGFLAERYSRPDKPFGHIGGYIIGNEVDSHWTWHNLGEASLDKIAHKYITEMRLAWLAVRQQSDEPRVFISLTHSWARPNSRSPLKNTAGKELLDLLTQLSRQGGDFGWDVAYHPYPENLFEPRFWDDGQAMFGFDSPMITFKNIELLPAYLARPEMTYLGKPRRVILSEQGLHTPDGKDGEKIQAAALALAMYRIEMIDGIDAFILHRHVDARGEGGLWLGLRHPPALGSQETMGDKKQSWDIFRAAETPRFRQVAAFAPKLAGFKSWKDANPRPGPFPDHAPEWKNFKTRDAAVYDLVAQIDQAVIDHTLAAGIRLVNLPDGGMVESVYLHPLQPDQPPATATYTVHIPAEGRPALEFQTYLEKPQSTGVVFRVLVNDQQIFEQPVNDQTMRESRVDLSDFAGQHVSLTLEVGSGKANSYDQAHWLAPAIVLTRTSQQKPHD